MNKMLNKSSQISNNVLRQVVMLAVIFSLSGISIYYLREYIPALLAASTLYIMTSKYHHTLTEKYRWKSWLSILLIISVSLVMIIIPLYFLVDAIIVKLCNATDLVPMITDSIHRIEEYVLFRFEFDLRSSLNLSRIGGIIARYSTKILNSTVNVVVMIAFTYLIFYFMLDNSRFLQRTVIGVLPIKKSNIYIVEAKVRRMVIANALGIPIIAVGQGFVLFLGYLIFGAEDPLFLFALTAIASIIPIVGGAVIFIPVVVMMFINGNYTSGVGILVFGIISCFIDNIFRFTFLKRIEDIHPLNSVFGIILGLKLFGFMGLIFGPIVVSLIILLIQVYHNEFTDKDLPKFDCEQ